MVEVKEGEEDKIISNSDYPICPYCGHSCDRKEIIKEIYWFWNYVTCGKCGRNFVAKTVRMFQTRKKIQLQIVEGTGKYVERFV
jgi:DNA-directed RNA polymerase subunit RPC12/RpoP